MVRKIYAGILVDRVLRINMGLIDDEQGGFRAGRRITDQIFALKQIGEEVREKKRRMYVGFRDLEKACNRNNGKLLNRIKSMYFNSQSGLCQSKRG